MAEKYDYIGGEIVACEIETRFLKFNLVSFEIQIKSLWWDMLSFPLEYSVLAALPMTSLNFTKPCQQHFNGLAQFISKGVWLIMTHWHLRWFLCFAHSYACAAQSRDQCYACLYPTIHQWAVNKDCGCADGYWVLGLAAMHFRSYLSIALIGVHTYCNNVTWSFAKFANS